MKVNLVWCMAILTIVAVCPVISLPHLQGSNGDSSPPDPHDPAQGDGPNLEIADNTIPVLKTSSSEIQKYRGEEVTLNCEVEDLAQHVRLWWFNSDLLYANDLAISKKIRLLDHMKLNLNTGALTVSNLDSTFNGQYKCQITNVAVTHTLVVSDEVPPTTTELILVDNSISGQPMVGNSAIACRTPSSLVMMVMISLLSFYM